VRLHPFAVLVASLVGQAPAPEVVEPGVGMPHPRAYGTNARVLGRYVRQATLRLEDAVRKMTSLPAQRFGLTDRGSVRPGLWADLAVFDADAVADRSTYEAPHAPAEGFRYVVVNGELVVDGGRPLASRPGRVLAPVAVP
jgi:N-acyl-D-amino-acid deacylase